MEALNQILSKLEHLELSLQVQNSTWLDISGTAEYLHLSTSKLYKLVASGSIPFKKINAKILFSRRSLDLWLVTGKINSFTKTDRQKAEAWI